MAPTTRFLVSSLFAALVHGHAVILNAQGLADSPASVGFGVDPAIARNCTSISPCQQDATLIREAEIAANIVNTCGRTELGGNIDVGENTENAIAAKKVTQVQRGTELTVTIHQVNADGAGPFVCDLDQTSNAGTFVNLTVLDNVPGVNGFSQVKTQAFDIKVQLPDDFTCIGGSTGDICTVRCRNNALAGPFGGCFPIQQVDTTASQNRAETIDTLKKLDVVLSQVQQNQKDFPAAAAANQIDGSDEGQANRKALDAILSNTVVSVAAPTQTLSVEFNSVAPNPLPTQGAGNGNQGGNNGNNGNNGNQGGNGQGNNGNQGGNQGGNRGGNRGGNQGGNGQGNNGQGNQGQGNNRGGNGNNAKRSRSGLKWAWRL
jgi:hypothetical protein